MDMGEIGRAGGVLPRRVAVVGGGIAGLATAWLLSRQPGRFSVTLYDAGCTLGGHTNTVDVTVEGVRCPVDTGFLVFNRKTYPNLCALFACLGVESVASEMSFGVSLSQPDLEWAGSDLGTLFAQKSNLVKPGMWRMLADIARFNRETTRMALESSAPEQSLGAYLASAGYGAGFRDWYLLPMAAAIWSCPTSTMLDYPLSTFVRFCHNHGLLQILDRPQWLTVKDGGRSYVRKIAALLDDVRLGAPVERVERDGLGVWVTRAGQTERFDEVVLACHSDQALRILGNGATARERATLGAVRYQPNRAVLHTDPALLPRRRKVWSAWNYLAGEGKVDARPVSVSYLINRLQPLPFETPVVVSLNPFREPERKHVLAEFDYAHPVFDQAAIAAQAELPRLQGHGGVWFAGAWTGYGFHEDGLKSALRIADALKVPVPWRGAEASPTVVPLVEARVSA